ncbi:hypothetical protein BaRGS_00027148 [Batillaria attramentaria]|uniref:Uncharacterized protein n=1 Tax=Batillaria attramentaria TaxID=370345 RepID=A0ABD0K3F2_9CAEN
MSSLLVVDGWKPNSDPETAQLERTKLENPELSIQPGTGTERIQADVGELQAKFAAPEFDAWSGQRLA